MKFIEKHKALIITSMLMGIIVLGLYNINMVSKQKEQAEILMEIPEEFLAKEEEPEEETEQESREIDPSQRTHQAYDEDFEDSEDIEQRIKSLSESEETPEEETSENEEEIAINEEKEKEEPTPEDISNRNSSLTYVLKDRKAVNLPNPVYTCNGSGKVVVKVEVNQNGYVVETKVDKKKSTTRNECLFDNAMNYARQALFSRSTIEKQEGSITYYFNYGG